MKRSTSALRALALVPALGLAGCIFSIDTHGSDWTGHHHQHRSPPAVVGSGIAREEVRDVPSFHAVEVSGDLVVRVDVAPDQGPVVVRGDDNLVELLRTEVVRGVLYVGLEGGSYQPRRDLEVEVTAASLDALVLVGGGELGAKGVQAESFSVTLTGSGEIRVKGAAGRLDVLLNGSGDLELDDLSARAARVTLNGSGKVELDVLEELDAKVSGSGAVRYRGKPAANVSVAGSGSVRGR